VRHVKIAQMHLPRVQSSEGIACSYCQDRVLKNWSSSSPKMLVRMFQVMWASKWDICCADLQQAFQKAMDRIGMEAESPAVNAQVLAQTDRERELLERIAELEAQLQVQSQH